MSDAYIREKSAVRIGSGAGFSGDRIEPAVVLAEYGRLDYLVFECLAERTIARAVRSRMADPDGGYDPLLIERMTAVLPTCARQNTRIISNMGAANPVGAARATAATARGLGLSGLKIAAVIGDDVLQIATTHGALDGLAERAISANAYMGAEPVVECQSASKRDPLSACNRDPL
uniref:acyclic terpene utilization AtuA family protein n=1 Tax=Brevundimonas sp. TaxID=1871086 RepID=UPI0028AB002F